MDREGDGKLESGVGGWDGMTTGARHHKVTGHVTYGRLMATL